MAQKSRTVRTQIGQFVMIPRWVLERVARQASAAGKDADAAARAVYVYAILGAKFANSNQRASRERELLAAEAGISLPAIARSLGLLRAAGALKTERRHRADGAVMGLEYILIQVEPADTNHQVQPDTKASGHHRIQPDSKDATNHQVQPDTKAAPDHQVQPETMVEDLRIQPDMTFVSTGIPLVKEEPDPLNQIRKDLSAAPTNRPALLDLYHDGFVTRFGQKPLITPGKDGRLLKVVEDSHGYGVARQLLEWFFRIRDPFINNSSYSVGVFYAVFNRLVTTYRPADPPVTEQTELLRDARARSEKVQQEREAEARRAIVALSPAALDALKRLVTTEMAELYQGIATYMKPEEYQKAIKSATVQHVVNNLCKGGKSVTEVMAQFARSHAA